MATRTDQQHRHQPSATVISRSKARILGDYSRRRGGLGTYIRQFISIARVLFEKLENALAVASGVAAVTMMVLITRDAVGRYLFGNPLRGTSETVASYLMVALVWLGSAWTLRQGGHPSVNLLTARLSNRVKFYLKLIPSLAAFVVCSYIGYGTLVRGLEGWSRTMRNAIVPLPEGAGRVILGVGALVLSVRILITLFGKDDVSEEEAGDPDGGSMVAGDSI